MTVHYTDDWLTVLHGDVRDELRTLPDESVHCVITSPPYWGLRDYGTATWDGGLDDCPHRVPATGSTQNKGNNNREVRTTSRTACPCGAVRLDNQLGLEPTPEQYVENMVAVFREVRRVLRSDGTLWLNLGDSYAGSWGNQGRKEERGTQRPINGPMLQSFNDYPDKGSNTGAVPAGLKPKDLVGIPWRVAFALQADGWYLRSDIIWSKPNPMPESVTDRPTKSHEYLFLLSKSARYFFDADAVRTEQTDWTFARGHVAATEAGVGNGTKAGLARGITPNPAGRNIRSVWTIATAPYPGAHFATFPPKLVEPCIKAGTSEKGVCPECGAPWERVVRVTAPDGRTVEKAASQRTAEVDGAPLAGDNRIDIGNRASWGGAEVLDRAPAGWRPSCAHRLKFTDTYGGEITPVPATVLDPFAGSGTTGMVAQSLSRRAVLIDLNVDYLGQLMERNREIPLGLEAS